MTKKLKRSVADLVAEAKAEITELTPGEAMARHGRDDTVLVDLRDPRELERDGRVPGAFHCPRGMLEFWIDPESPYYKPVFGEDKTYVFFCAGGFRSALATKVAQDMGLEPVAHIVGGFGAWKKEGGGGRRGRLTCSRGVNDRVRSRRFEVTGSSGKLCGANSVGGPACGCRQ